MDPSRQDRGDLPAPLRPFFCLGEFGTKVKNDRMPEGSQNTQKRSRNARIREPIDVKLAGTVSRAKTHHRDGGMRPEHPIE